MKMKLTKISTKSFITIFTIINVLAGFVLGALVTVVSMAVPEEQGAGVIGPWAILIFPILNGFLGLTTGAFLTGTYNFLVKRFGGVEVEFETVE